MPSYKITISDELQSKMENVKKTSSRMFLKGIPDTYLIIAMLDFALDVMIDDRLYQEVSQKIIKRESSVEVKNA